MESGAEMKSAPVLEDILGKKYGPLAELHLAEYIPALNRLTSAETGSCFGDYLDDLYLVSKNALGKNMFGAF